MKKLFSFFLALCLTSANAATTVPVQLLNPTGSTSGQAIVSTGSSSAPAWGSVSGASLAAQAANTVLANVTASSASPTAVAMPSCSTTSSALTYTTSTGFTCNTTVNASTLGGTAAASYALLASPTFTGTVTAAALTTTGNFTPSQTNGIVGTTTNNTANAGSVGECFASAIASGSAVSLSNSTAANITSISPTAGDWDVWGQVVFLPGATTTQTVIAGWVSTTSATLPSFSNTAAAVNYFAGSILTGSGTSLPTGIAKIRLASTTPIFLSALSTFGTSTQSAYGYIVACRRR